MKNKKKFLGDNKNVAILVLSIILVIIVVLFLLFFVLNQVKESQKIDASNYSFSELVNLFKNEGYEFELYYKDKDSKYFYTTYATLENKDNGISISKIHNNSIGTIFTFNDDTINDESVNLIDTSENDTVEKEQQYTAFENWLKKYNITKLQVSDMLDTYYDLHKDEAEDLDALINNALAY